MPRAQTNKKTLKIQLEHIKNKPRTELEKKQFRELNLLEDQPLSSEDLLILTQYIKNNTIALGFEKLLFKIDPQVLQTEAYRQWIEAVNLTSLKEITYVFTKKDLSDDSLSNIAQTLTDEPTKSLHCPLIIKQDDHVFSDPQKIFSPLKNQLIENMQAYYQAKWISSEDQSIDLKNNSSFDDSELPLAFDPNIKPNPLKALINASADKKNEFDYLLVTEVQRVVQMQEVTEIIHEQHETVEISQQQEAIATYSGTLIDFETFKKEPYSTQIREAHLYTIFKTEWFGNLPFAVKYLSPEAAAYIASHANSFVALNVDFKHPERLPDGLFLQQTELGEWIMDYDPDRKPNPSYLFTPKPYHHPVSEPIYQELSLPSNIQSLINKEPAMRNVWMKYGQLGVDTLSRILENGDQKNPEFSKQLKERFLSRFSQWDVLFDDPKVITSLEELSQYSPEQFNCLMNFLSKTDKSSLYLPDVLLGFETFWQEWSKLALKENLALDSIVEAWTQPSAGHPLVYMERLLTILKNARNVTEQLDVNGYDFALMSTLSRDKKGNLQYPKYTPDGLVYLSEKPKAYFVRGMEKEVLLPDDIDLTNLEQKLKQQDFKIALLAITSKAGHTHRERISLNHYEGYYASKHEGFKLITEPMKLIYDPEQQNEVPFSKDRSVYRSSLETLAARTCLNQLKWNYLTDEQVQKYQSEQAIFLLDKEAITALRQTIKDNAKTKENKKTKEEFLNTYGPPHVIPYTGQAISKEYKVYVDKTEWYEYFYLDQMNILSLDPRYARYAQEKNIDPEEAICGAWRYAGQQTSGMDLRRLISQLKAFDFRFFDTDNQTDWEHRDSINKYSKILLASLFLTTHTRTSGDYNFTHKTRIRDSAFGNIDRMFTHPEVYTELLNGMIELYHQDIHMTEEEGIALYDRLGLMNSTEFESQGLNKSYCIQELFDYLKTHRQATLLLLNYINQYNSDSRWPMVYAIDMVNYLERDPIVAQNYFNDLLLFTYLLDDFYHNHLPQDKKQELTPKLDRIQYYLKLATESDKPNNLDYAYQLIINSTCRLNYDTFIALYDDLNKLSKFDPKDTLYLCEKHIGYQLNLLSTLRKYDYPKKDKLYLGIAEGKIICKGQGIKSLIELEGDFAQPGGKLYIAIQNGTLETISFECEKKLREELSQKGLQSKFKTQVPQFFYELSVEIREPLLRLLVAFALRKEGSLVFQFAPPDTKLSPIELQKINDNLYELEQTIEHLKKNELEKASSSLTNESKVTDQIQSLEAQLLKAQQHQETVSAQLDELTQQVAIWNKTYEQFRQKDTSTLQKELNDAWSKLGPILSYAKSTLYPFIQQIAKASFKQAINHINPCELRTQLTNCFRTILLWKDIDDFKSLEFKLRDLSRLVQMYKSFIEHNPSLENDVDFAKLFTNSLQKKHDYQTFHHLTQLLLDLKQRDAKMVLNAYVKTADQLSNIESCNQLILCLERLNNSYLSTEHLCQIVKLCQSDADVASIETWLPEFIKRYELGEDPMIARLLEQQKPISASEFGVLLEFSKDNAPRFAMAKLLDDLPDDIRRQLTKTPIDSKSQKVFQILALCYSRTSKKERQEFINKNSYQALITELMHRTEEDCQNLHNHFAVSGASMPCLLDRLHEGHSKKLSIEDIIKSLEKAPYGHRDDTEHFDTKHVERVINRFVDLNNKSKYPDYYRKQMMEAFLFINEAGHNLPMYYGKPAKELSNTEIKELFWAIKRGEPKECDPFKRRLLALGLIRESIYRTTGQFPYSTQMIAIIDCMMHSGDLISNIDTGQGKSMIDMMKACILYLDSDRVDISTSSLVDAKRDLEEFSPFLSFLGIPHATEPVTSEPGVDHYQLDGINISTKAEYALYIAASKGKPGGINDPKARVSAVFNESDHSILDDHVIYRYATTEGAFKLSESQEWLYDAINHFVTHDSIFLSNRTSPEQDAYLLRRYLNHVAHRDGKKREFIQEIPEQVLKRWIDSALLVNYRLAIDKDAVLSDKPERKKIRGLVKETDTIKIIQPDGKISQITEYGNGVQQLWFSKLSREYKDKNFIKSPESHTIISMNNKNMVDYYRSRRGIIWGSSGTVGSDPEITIQYQKYGFDFSKVEPHQEKQTKEYAAVLAPDQKAQFEELYKQLVKERQEHIKRKNKDVPPTLIFLKDIQTVKAFNAFLEKKEFDFQRQMYTGLGDEANVIEKAAHSGMITITTPALTRNTNIHYKKSMSVYITFVATVRQHNQMLGRTGRQGSEGHAFTILNNAELQGKTIQTIQQELLEKTEATIEFHETLYDVLGYFLRHIENKELDPTFYQKHWALFSEQLEETYREQKAKQLFDEKTFIAHAVEKFNELPHQSPLKTQEVMNQLKNLYVEVPREINESYQNDIYQKDCIPADITAYQYFKTKNDEIFSKNTNALVSKEEVKIKLKALFAEHIIKNKNSHPFSQSNRDYLLYLSLNKSSLEVIREAHTEFLNEFLQDHNKQSKKDSWIKPWFGFQGHLNKIVDNFNYILLFKALTDVSGEKVDFNQVKSSVQTLLNEYRSYNWFLSGQRKTTVETLLKEIQSVNTEKQLIETLIHFKRQEILEDKKVTTTRWLLPVNPFGTSRFQNTLDRAIKLASVCGRDEIKDTSQLINLLQEVDATHPQNDESKIKPIIRAENKLKHMNKSDMVFRIIQRSLNAFSKHNSLFSTVDKGMLGRRSDVFFQQHPVSAQETENKPLKPPRVN